MSTQHENLCDVLFGGDGGCVVAVDDDVGVLRVVDGFGYFLCHLFLVDDECVPLGGSWPVIRALALAKSVRLMYSALSLAVKALAVVVLPTQGVPVMSITRFIEAMWPRRGFNGFA